MTAHRLIAIAALLLTIPLAQAADVEAAASCLSRDQRRAAMATGKVVPLSAAIRATRARKNEVVKARLCQGPKGLVYLLTLLARDGKVTQATVDAASGTLAEGG
jgi:hypothetical protein